MLSPLHDVRRYACPGEPGEISRALHLARLAAGYAKCRACVHAHDFGALRPQLPPQSEDRADAETAELIRVDHGLRGIAVNQLGRHQAITWAAALASLLWDSSERGSAPLIVIGYDERPAAPDVMLGLAMGLERMSCRVIDIGLTTEPCLRFAVNHLDADAGVYVTGSGCDPAWIGFDICRKYGLPAESAFLDLWQRTQMHPVSRPSRSAGSLAPFAAGELYEAGLWNRFHALRPLEVVCGAASPNLLARIDRLFRRLPGRLHPVSLPTRRRDLADPADADVQRIGASVREHAAHLGVVIDDDAANCGFLNERGELVNATALAARSIAALLHDQPGGTVILSTEVWDDLAPAATSHGGRPVLVAAADRAARLMVEQAVLAVGADQRLWFGENQLPVCDAIFTLAAVLQLLSLSDADFSRVLGG